MPKFNYKQNAFNYGLVSEKLFGRNDIKEYNQGCRRLLNMTVTPQGGAERRPGTVFLKKFEGLSAQPMIFSFTFESDNYLVVILKDSDGVYSGSTLVSNATVYKTTVSSGLEEVATFLTGFGNHTVDIAADFYGRQGFSTTQNGPYLTIVHESGLFEPMLVVYNKYAAQQWGAGTFNEYTNVASTGFHYYKFVPYAVKNSNTSHTLTVTSVGGTYTHMIESNIPMFSGYEKGRLIRFVHGTSEVVFQIGSGASTRVYGNVIHGSAPTSGTSSTVWQLSRWCANNYPFCCTTYQGRLIFGGCAEHGDVMSASKAYNMFDFMDDFLVGDTTEEKSTDPFQDIIGYDEYDRIHWIRGGKDLLVGTDRGEFSVHGNLAANSKADPGAVRDIRRYTSVGSHFSLSANMDNLTIFVDKSKVQLTSLIYSYKTASYERQNLSSLVPDLLHTSREVSDTITANQRFFSMVWSATLRILFLTDYTGKVYGLTIDTAAGTTAWQTYDFGDVRNITKITDYYGNDTIALTILRDGEYYLEKLPESFKANTLTTTVAPWASQDRIIPYFVDSALYLTSLGVPSSAWDVEHLTGMNVSYLLNGVPGEGFVGDDGKLHTASGNYLVVGLPYTSLIETNPLSTSGYYGPTIDSIQRVHSVVMNLYRTWHVQVGKVIAGSDKVYDVKLTENFTGQHEVAVPNGFSRGETVVMKTDKPLPWGISSLVLKGTANE